jgi:small-conductance mechanosensitive channel
VSFAPPEHPADLTPLQRRALQNTRAFLDEPPTMLTLLRKGLLRLTFLVLYFGICGAGFLYYGYPVVAAFIVGMGTGAVVLSLGASRQFVNLWPVSAAIIDRRKVDYLLGEPPDPVDQP